MPFTNPIVAGNTLVREAIESPDYSTGTAGWAIKRDGSVEFNDAVIRGTITSPGASITNDSVVIPSDATDGTPGYQFTTVIPSELSAYYTSTNALSAVRIGYTETSGLYHYEGLNATAFIVTGWVYNNNVYETYRYKFNGGSNELRYGRDSARPVAIITGPESGSGLCSHDYVKGSLLQGDGTSVLSWSGTASFGSITSQNIPVLRGLKGSVTVNVGSGVSSVVQSVAFSTTLGSVPHVSPNKATAPSGVSRWVVDAINITATGFDIFFFSPTSTNTSSATSATITWAAIEET